MPDDIDLNKLDWPANEFGLALMMIRAGCDNPQEVAAQALQLGRSGTATQALQMARLKSVLEGKGRTIPPPGEIAEPDDIAALINRMHGIQTHHLPDDEANTIHKAAAVLHTLAQRIAELAQDIFRAEAVLNSRWPVMQTLRKFIYRRANALRAAGIRTGFTCPRCGAVSHSLNDTREQYCARCHVFTDEQ